MIATSEYRPEMRLIQKVLEEGVPVTPILDPSELLRPEPPLWGDKPPGLFRDYSVDPEDPLKERIRRIYHLMHRNQTVAYVKKKRAEWLTFSHGRMTVRQALELLNTLVDESDPDTEIPNIVHAFQTAERIRHEHPDKPWLQLTGLVHDLGKVLALLGEPQWAVVGDTFVVGCRWPDSIVYRDTSFEGNQDGEDPRYSSECGIYERHCGLDNCMMSWGHDEYLYQVLVHNGAKLPEEALYMIRYHSFYPYHTGREYSHLCDARDTRLKPWLLMFNKYDLYTKSERHPDMRELWPYYQSLIDLYMPGELEW